MWIYCRCQSCQCLCPGGINDWGGWGKTLKCVKWGTLFVLFGPTNARHPSGCRTALFEHHTSGGMTCQLLKFICSYLQLTCDVVKTGLKSFSPPSWQVALTRYAKLTSRNKHSMFLYLLCVQQNINTVMWVTADVLLQEEISSDKEQLSMKQTWGKRLLFELAL